MFETDEETRERIRSASREILRIDSSQIAILFSGKLTTLKSPDLLLRAIKEMKTQLRKKITLLFVGSGEMETALKASANCEPRVNVVLAGFQSQKQLSPYYHACDLLVLPSQSETWGLVINEALSHGLPCVVSDHVGCARDLIEPGVSGEIFKTNSVQSLVSAIERCLHLTLNRDVRQQCRHKVENYTVTKAALGIAEAYRAVACDRLSMN